MVGPRGLHSWFLRAALLFGLLGALTICNPSDVLAKPFPREPGPTESGDPTADDVPSPTPKPKGHAAQFRQTVTESSIRTGGTNVRIPWEVYLRLLVHYRVW
jgi:hypothetical protein